MYPLCQRPLDGDDVLHGVGRQERDSIRSRLQPLQEQTLEEEETSGGAADRKAVFLNEGYLYASARRYRSRSRRRSPQGCHRPASLVIINLSHS